MKLLNRLTFLILLGFWLTPPIRPDSSDISMSRNALTIEGLGPGILYSVNYENSFNNYSFLRVGFFVHQALGFPILYNLRFGGLSHQFIVGAGMVPYIESTFQGWKARAFFAGNLGYRWVFGDNVFMEIAFTPLMLPCGNLGSGELNCSNAFLPFGGLTIGYLF